MIALGVGGSATITTIITVRVVVLLRRARLVVALLLPHTTSRCQLHAPRKLMN
jgi:hypothetical protein